MDPSRVIENMRTFVERNVDGMIADRDIHGFDAARTVPCARCRATGNSI